jgi:hypothetical protein
MRVCVCVCVCVCVLDNLVCECYVNLILDCECLCELDIMCGCETLIIEYSLKFVKLTQWPTVS